jgi:UDP-N-acetylglucosamine 1-carboxyvinyltransferase
MCASLLTDEPLVLGNVPHLADITTMANLLSQHGVQVSLEGHDDKDGHIGRVLSLRAQEITNTTAPYELVRKMRASVLVLGPLLARAGEAEVSLPCICMGSRNWALRSRSTAAIFAPPRRRA